MAQLFDVARIGRDAELRYTPGNNSTAVVNLALACDYGRKGDDGRRPTQWVEASLWGKQAEALAPYLLKGQQVLVTVDDIRIEEYQSQGATRSKLVGRISSIKLVGSAPQGQQQGQPHPQAQAARQPAPRQQPAQNQQTDYDSFDDDIPF